MPKSAMMRACIAYFEKLAAEHAARGDAQASSHWTFQAAELRRMLKPTEFVG